MPARSMPLPHVKPASGHVFVVQRAKGPVWFAKYRLPDGRQVKQRIGPAHTGRGRPPAGHVTKRGAEAWLQSLLERADAQMLPGSACLAVTFREAAEEWLRYSAEERACKPSTLVQYRSAVRCHLVPAFGDWLIGDITPHDLERFRSTLTFSARSKNRLMTEAHGIFKRAMKVYGLPRNPAAEVERLRVRSATDLQVFSPEEVHALVRAAACEQDAAIFLVAAFTGLRMGELIALRWRDVDFTASRVRVAGSFSGGQLTTPKSGKVRSVPMASVVASALARLAAREHWTGPDDLVFPGELGAWLDNSALRRRYKDALRRAGLRQLRFHDLRHTFGTNMIAKADIVRVQEWMGHADIQTTRRYLHFRPQHDDAALVAEAFAPAQAASAAAA